MENDFSSQCPAATGGNISLYVSKKNNPNIVPGQWCGSSYVELRLNTATV